MSDGPFNCCETCIYRGSVNCEECVDADMYDFDEDAVEELEAA